MIDWTWPDHGSAICMMAVMLAFPDGTGVAICREFHCDLHELGPPFADFAPGVAISREQRYTVPGSRTALCPMRESGFTWSGCVSPWDFGLRNHSGTSPREFRLEPSRMGPIGASRGDLMTLRGVGIFRNALPE